MAEFSEAEKALYSQLRREELEEKKKLALQNSSESVNALRLNQRRLQDLIEDCPLCGTRMLSSIDRLFFATEQEYREQAREWSFT